MSPFLLANVGVLISCRRISSVIHFHHFVNKLLRCLIIFNRVESIDFVNQI